MSESLDHDEAPLAIVISTPAIAPSLTLVDSDFVARLAEAEDRIAAIKVTDAKTANDAAQLQKAVTQAGSALEGERLRLLRPFLDAQNAINQAAKNAASRIELAKSSVKAKINAYQQAQEQLAREAERKRQEEAAKAERARLAEIARLEAIAKKEAAEAKARADELLRQQEEARKAAEAKPAVEDLDAEPEVEEEPLIAPPPEKTDTQKQLEALMHAPAPVAAPIVAAKIAGVAFRSWVEIVSTDVNQLPEPFVIRTADTKAIRSAYVTAWREGQPLPTCPGVVFVIKKEPITR